MSIETIEPEVKPEVKDGGVDLPPAYGRCPVCNKELRPRDKHTGELLPSYMLERDGYWRRAVCLGCGAILYYKGDGVWVVWDGKLHEFDEVAEEQHEKTS